MPRVLLGRLSPPLERYRSMSFAVAKVVRKNGTSKKFRKNFTLTSKFFFVFENFVIFICEKRASKQTKSLYKSRKLKDK